MKRKRVHVTDLDGNPRYNRLFDDGTNVLCFESPGGFLARDELRWLNLQLHEGWLSDEEWGSK